MVENTNAPHQEEREEDLTTEASSVQLVENPEKVKEAVTSIFDHQAQIPSDFKIIDPSKVITEEPELKEETVINTEESKSGSLFKS